MLKKYDDKIGFRELFAIITFCLGIRITDMTPVLLIKSGLNAAWMLPIISGLFMLIPLLCLLSLLKLYKNKNLIDIIYHLTGRIFGFFLVFILLIIGFEYIIVTTRSHADILSTMFYSKTPMFFILLILILCSSYISSKGIHIVGSLCWLTYPILQAVVLLLVIMIWNEVDMNYLFPLGGPGIKTLLKEGTTHITIIGEMIVLSVFFTNIRSYKDYKNASLFGLAISVITFSMFLILFIGAYGYPTLMTINYPYHQLTRLVHIGRFARNVESFFLGFWAIGSSIRFAIYYYMVATILKSFTKVKKTKTLMPFIATIVFIVALIPENYTNYILQIRKYGINFFWIYFISLPILLWGIAKLKGEYKP